MCVILKQALIDDNRQVSAGLTLPKKTPLQGRKVNLIAQINDSRHREQFELNFDDQKRKAHYVSDVYEHLLCGLQQKRDHPKPYLAIDFGYEHALH